MNVCFLDENIALKVVRNYDKNNYMSLLNSFIDREFNNFTEFDTW